MEKDENQRPTHVAASQIIEMLSSEGPKMADQIESRLPFSKQLVDRILHELESRNVISVGFYKQTDDAEYILKIDEHRLTGEKKKWLSTLVQNRSLTSHS